MAIQWYFKKDGQEHGPVTSDDIRMLASLGMLKSTDLVRKSEMTRWAQAASLKGLFPAPSLQTHAHSAYASTAPVLPQFASTAIAQPPRGTSSGLSEWIWYLTAAAAVCALAACVYRFIIEPSSPKPMAHHAEPLKWEQPTTEPVLASVINDPLLMAISSESPFDRGMAFRQVRAATVPAKLRGQVHQIICDTLDNRAFASIWSSAAHALGEIGTRDDLPKLVPLIEKAPVETQCSAMAAAMVLDPEAGLKHFEPRAGDEKYGGTTAGYLADWGARCEPVAVAMLKSPERQCRYHALFLLKAFGTSNALVALAEAKKTEPDKLIADGYQLTIDAINSRNQ